MLNAGDSLPDGGPLAAEQAAAVDSLLESSESGRAYLIVAIDDINACEVTGSTIINIRNAANARADLAIRIDAANAAELPNGARIKAGMQLAVRASYDGDRAYLQWVLAAGDRCPKQTDPAYEAVRSTNAASHTAKEDLVADWNPVASKYGFKKRSITII